MEDKKRDGNAWKKKRKAISSFHILYALYTIKLNPPTCGVSNASMKR